MFWFTMVSCTLSLNTQSHFVPSFYSIIKILFFNTYVALILCRGRVTKVLKDHSDYSYVTIYKKNSSICTNNSIYTTVQSFGLVRFLFSFTKKNQYFIQECIKLIKYENNYIYDVKRFLRKLINVNANQRIFKKLYIYLS